MSLSNRDPNQIVQFEHDDKSNAKRVVVVGQEINIDSSKIAESLEKALSSVKVSLQSSLEQKDQEIVEKHIFIPQLEIKTIEVPVIIKEIEYREIERPIIIEKIVTVEVPIIVKEYEIKYIDKERDIPLIMKITAIIQTVCVLALLISNLISHLK